MKDSEKRTKTFQKNQQQDSLLQELNGLLSQSEAAAVEQLDAPSLPVILIMGAPRSGSTLLYQYLAHSGCFAYPTNLLARFYQTIYIGSRIQQVLTYGDQFGELAEFQSSTKAFQSNLGKTTGALSPHEFSYFWRHHFPINQSETHYMPEELLKQADTRQFLKELAAMEYAQQKPVLMKGMLLNFHVPFLHAIVNNALFIHIKREPAYNMHSLLQAREKYAGTRGEWYSFYPPQYHELAQKPPEAQVAGQIFYINQAITSAFAAMPDENTITVQYEEFCERPRQTFGEVRDKLAAQGHEGGELPAELPASFENSNSRHNNQAEMDRFKDLYQQFVDEAAS